MFCPVKVFDVSQTDGKPLPELASSLSGTVPHYEAFLEAVRRSAPVPIEFEPIRGNDIGVVKADFENRDCACGASSYAGHLDLRGAGLCIRLGAGAAQYGNRPAGRGRLGDILPAERPYFAGDCISHKPLWAAEAGLLVAGQGTGFEICNTGFGLRLKGHPLPLVERVFGL